jgi:hypothetical protein
MARIVLVLAGVAALAAGCGDDSPGGATAPSPTTSGVTVTVSSPLRVGQTTQASASPMSAADDPASAKPLILMRLPWKRS